MPSAVRIDVPASGNATTQSVRDNFLTVRNEIDALQAGGGATGAVGATGASGASGPSGAIGMTGASGLQGVTGASGTGGGGGGPPVQIQSAEPTGDGAANGSLWYHPGQGVMRLRIAGIWEEFP